MALADSLHLIDSQLLGWWLCERQLPCGGLNGRPEKKEDVCYSWWVLSSLSMMNKVHWINSEALSKFILLCQDTDNGGISDRPGNMVDVFHTYFGIAGLSLVAYDNQKFKPIDPMYALPLDVVERLQLKSKYLDEFKLKAQTK